MGLLADDGFRALLDYFLTYQLGGYLELCGQASGAVSEVGAFLGRGVPFAAHWCLKV